MYVENKLDVMANSWPLYFLVSMFLNNYFVDIEGIVNTFYEKVCSQLARFKEDPGEQPMLRYYQLRNLIYTFTSIVRFLLCFKTPITEKTSSQQYYSAGGSHHQHSQH